MNILLTGATGFIGKNLLCKLIELNFNVSAIIRNKSKINQSINPDNINIYILDNNANDLYDFIKNSNIECIIHLAGEFLKSNSLKGIESLVENNIEFGTKLLDIASRLDVKYFINTGSYFQNHNSLAYNPINLYAATKEAFITISKHYTNISNMKFITLKLTDTFGIDDTRDKIWNIWSKMIEGKIKGALDMSSGTQIIALNYIDNVTDAYLKIIELIKSDAIFPNEEPFFMNSDERYSLKELSLMFEEISKVKLNINWGKYKDVSSSIKEPIKPTNLIPNFTPKVSVKEGIAKFLKV